MARIKVWARWCLELLLKLYIGGMVAGAFWLDPSIGGFCCFLVAVGLGIYIPVRLLVTGRWWDLFHLGLAFVDGLLADHGRPHGHR